MARVTIEDCTKIIPSRFELVVLAAQRAKDISSGSKLTIDRGNDKNAVVALREISQGNVSPESLRESVISRYQKVKSSEFVDRPEEEDMSETMSEIESEVKSLTSHDDFNDDDFIEEGPDSE